MERGGERANPHPFIIHIFYGLHSLPIAMFCYAFALYGFEFYVYAYAYVLLLLFI